MLICDPMKWHCAMLADYTVDELDVIIQFQEKEVDSNWREEFKRGLGIGPRVDWLLQYQQEQHDLVC